jgi:hypothetical protein
MLSAHCGQRGRRNEHALFPDVDNRSRSLEGIKNQYNNCGIGVGRFLGYSWAYYFLLYEAEKKKEDMSRVTENSEKCLGTIHAGMGPVWHIKYYDLIFTDRRLIVARTGSNWPLILGVLAFLPLMKRNKVSERLSSLPPDKVLTDSKDNFSIPYDEINKVELRRSWMMGNKLVIYTSTRKYSHPFWGKRPRLQECNCSMNMRSSSGLLCQIN